MIQPRQIFHLLRINRVLVRHGLDEIIFATHFFRPYRFLFYLAPWNWFRSHSIPRAVRIRRCLEDLGPIFVKFGQILSTRKDLLPDDIAVELARLQDDVPPFDGEQARAIIEEAYQKPIADVFAEFDSRPLASASIAQVHPARLHDGTDVVVKVIRPGIKPVIDRDLKLMYYLAGLAQRYWKDGRRLRPVEVVQEFEKVLNAELDLVKEAANASQLRRNFEHSDKLYVPEIYWPLATRNVMTMERIYGIPVNDLEQIRARGIDVQRLAEDGVEIFYTQVFKHNFFHADMHPGNIFVSDEGRYIAVDFGIMGTLTREDQRYLAENFVAFFNRDYRRVAELHVESGWVAEDIRVDEFEAEIRSVCEPNFNKPLKDISFGVVLMRLFDTARRFDIQVQPQLVLLQKTLLNIEGLGRQLYPDLDLWQTAKPFLESWMHEQLGIRSFIRQLKKELPHIIEKTPELPMLLHEYLRQHNSGKARLALQSAEIEKLHKTLRRSRRQLQRSLLGATAVVVSALVLITGKLSGHAEIFAYLTAILGTCLLIVPPGAD